VTFTQTLPFGQTLSTGFDVICISSPTPIVPWHSGGESLLQSAIIYFMCGRYKLSRRKQVVEEYFDATSNEPDWNPRYNVAPTQSVPVIRQHPKSRSENSLSCAGDLFRHGRETLLVRQG
jgi:SOS response associated peptidase (SRAP)